MPPKFLIYFKYTRTEIIYAHSSIIKFIKLNKILNLSLNLSSAFPLTSSDIYSISCKNTCH